MLWTFQHVSASPGQESHKDPTLWMFELELDQDPGREQPKHAEKDDDDDAWH